MRIFPLLFNDLAFSSKIITKDKILGQQCFLKNRNQHTNDGTIIGKSYHIRQILKMVENLSSSNSNITIMGEIGTGKKLIAKAIHQKSSRRNQPFMVIHCDTLLRNQIENELFGHIHELFTETPNNKNALLEDADGGTLLFSEIGELPLPIQVRLLRVIQDKQFNMIGNIKTIKTDVRVISSTTKDLERMVKRGMFHEELFYRLNDFQIRILPLRKRKVDIPLLAKHFIDKYSYEIKKEIKGISSSALNILMNYPFPGNILEFERIIQRCIILEKRPYISAEQMHSCIAEKKSAEKDHPTIRQIN